ncbi:hypothetical protein TrVFT333_000774 [Trichoderma virens FT-333]|nr:hypothetical protein TrVFT333_000774 [Trichoderma virens FT-333]
MVTPARRVGLSHRNSPGSLLKSIKSRTETTTTTTSEAAAAAAAAPKPKPESSVQSGRSQLKVPEPVPDDIFAPPLASSDVEDEVEDDDTAENAEATRASDQAFADSSDSDTPPRGAISSTTFTPLGHKGGRQTRQSRLRETKEAPQVEEEPEESQSVAKKRKRPSDASIDKTKTKKNSEDEEDDDDDSVNQSLAFEKEKCVQGEEGEETPISSSPPPAKFVMPAKLSDFVLPGAKSGGDIRDGDLSDGSSSGLSSLGSLFPDRDDDEAGEPSAPGAEPRLT